MKAYVICIIIVTLINFINEKFFMVGDKKSKFLSRLFLFLSFFILCFIAGVRDLTVGTDINVYVVRLYNLAIGSSNIFYYLKNANSDFLFSILIYLSSLFKNINFVLFMIEFAVALPIYVLAYKMKEEKSFTLNVLIFMLVMYCISLNLMRQSIAMSICILSYFLFDKGERKKSILCLFIAFLFHKTAFIFVFALFLNYLFKSNFKDKKFIIFFTIVGIIFFTPLLRPIVSLTSYSRYLNIDELREFSFLSILKRFFWMLLIIFGFRVGNDKNAKYNKELALLFVVISLLTTITSYSIPGTGRLGYYFNNLSYFIFMFEIPKVYKQRKTVAVLLYILLFGLWIVNTYEINDSSRVYPYSSSIVDFLN